MLRFDHRPKSVLKTLALLLVALSALQAGCMSTRHDEGAVGQTPVPSGPKRALVTTWTTSSPGHVIIWFQNQAPVSIIIYRLELTDCVNIIVPTTGQQCGSVFAPNSVIELTGRGAGLGRDLYRLDVPARDPNQPCSLHYTFHVDRK